MAVKTTAPEFIDESLIETKEAEAAALAAPVGRVVFDPAPAPATDWQGSLLTQMEQMVEAVVEKRIQANPPAPMGTVPFDLVKAPPAAPPSYKKHYRCDTYPELVIQRIDMTALDRGERLAQNALPGEVIKFRMGHLYTSDDNDIAQIEWMRSPSYGAGVSSVNPGIYEDGGTGIYRCTQGCDFVTADKDGYIAHMASRHMEEVRA